MILKCKICGGHGFTTTPDVFGSVFGQNRKPCPVCNGAGEFDLNVPEERLSNCKFCGGRGVIVSASSPLFGTTARICPTCKGLGLLERPQIAIEKSSLAKTKAVSSPPDESAKNGIASELNGLIVPAASVSSANTTSQYPAIVLVTVNENETHALLDAFLGEGKAPKHITISGITYNDLGIHGGHRLVNTICEMGAGGIGASQQRTRQAIAHWQPRAIIAVGIAFGLDETKQGIGDVLVSTQIQDYDLGRINKDGTLTPRGDKPSCADVLLNRLRQADARERHQRRSDWPKVRFGLVLSGQKLVDNHNYRKSLKALSPEAIGGEMEGIGLYVSASEAKVDWIIVKGICDWGHNKNRRQKDAWQSLAAKNAVCVLKTSLDAGSLYSSEYVSPVEARTTTPTEKEDTWAETEKTYELKEIFQDIRFYVRKGLTDEEQMTSEWLCTNCWTDKIKSIIQREGSKDNITTYFCPRCKTQFKWNRTIAATTYNPFLKITDVTDTPEYKAINLDNTAVNILLRLWKFPDGLTDKMIAKMLDLDIQTVTYHIEKLEQAKMIFAHWRPPRKWTLKKDGRGYLIERNLVS